MLQFLLATTSHLEAARAHVDSHKTKAGSTRPTAAPQYTSAKKRTPVWTAKSPPAVYTGKVNQGTGNTKHTSLVPHGPFPAHSHALCDVIVGVPQLVMFTFPMRATCPRIVSLGFDPAASFFGWLIDRHCKMNHYCLSLTPLQGFSPVCFCYSKKE